MNVLDRLAAANPVPDARVAELVPEPRREELLARVVRAPAPPIRRRRRVRPLLIAAAVLALLAAPSYAVARGLLGWLGGEPAPPEVVADFGSYARQLGFDPEPGKAVLVGEDRGGEFALYVTTNRQGGYCVLVSAPWKRPGKHGEGGSCVSAEQAAKPFWAGIGGGSSDPHVLVVAGRVTDPRARAVHLTRGEGLDVTRPVGAGGFFLAAVEGEACPDVPRPTTVRALSADGGELARTELRGLVCLRPQR